MPGKVPAVPVAPAEGSPGALPICHGLSVRVSALCLQTSLIPDWGSLCAGSPAGAGEQRAVKKNFSIGTGIVAELQCSSLCPGAA